MLCLIRFSCRKILATPLFGLSRRQPATARVRPSTLRWAETRTIPLNLIRRHSPVPRHTQTGLPVTEHMVDGTRFLLFVSAALILALAPAQQSSTCLVARSTAAGARVRSRHSGRLLRIGSCFRGSFRIISNTAASATAFQTIRYAKSIAGDSGSPHRSSHTRISPHSGLIISAYSEAVIGSRNICCVRNPSPS